MEFDAGQRLRAIREMHGMSQRALAKKAGVTNGIISMIEQNRNSPSLATLKKILDAITMASFLPGPMAINVASYIGFLLRGWKGAVVSFVSVLLPSFLLMILFRFLLKSTLRII